MYGPIEDALEFWKNTLNAYKHFASHYLQYIHWLAINITLALALELTLGTNISINISYKIFMAGHYHYNSLSTKYQAVITKNSIAITLGMHFTGDAIKPIRQAIHAIWILPIYAIHAISNICNILFNSITYLERIYAIFIFSHLEIHTYIDPTLSIPFHRPWP